MARPTPLQSWLIAFALTVGAVLFSIAYIDRPVADFVQADIKPTALYRWLELGFLSLKAAAALFFLCFFAAGAWALNGRPLPGWTATPLLCAWAITWAMAITVLLKGFLGRAEADPTWVVQHVYDFRWFHGRPDFQSFPSGTTALTCAVAAVVWLVAPRLRAPAGAGAVLMAVALVITNSHWVADVIAGAFLGVSTGWMTVRLRSERA